MDNQNKKFKLTTTINTNDGSLIIVEQKMEIPKNKYKHMTKESMYQKGTEISKDLHSEKRCNSCNEGHQTSLESLLRIETYTLHEEYELRDKIKDLLLQKKLNIKRLHNSLLRIDNYDHSDLTIIP